MTTNRHVQCHIRDISTLLHSGVKGTGVHQPDNQSLNRCIFMSASQWINDQVNEAVKSAPKPAVGPDKTGGQHFKSDPGTAAAPDKAQGGRLQTSQ